MAEEIKNVENVEKEVRELSEKELDKVTGGEGGKTDTGPSMPNTKPA